MWFLFAPDYSSTGKYMLQVTCREDLKLIDIGNEKHREALVKYSNHNNLEFKKGRLGKKALEDMYNDDDKHSALANWLRVIALDLRKKRDEPVFHGWIANASKSNMVKSSAIL